MVKLQLRREAQTLSLSELPLVIALFLATPLDLVIGVGAGLVYVVVRRQPLIKASFTIMLRVFGAVIAIAALQAGLSLAGGLGPAHLGPAV